MSPSDLRRYTVFYADQPGARLIHLDGTPTSILPVTGAAATDPPIEVSSGAIFLWGGRAYSVGAPGSPVSLGPADGLFKMPWPDTVGVQRGRQPGPVGAQFVSTNGDASVNSPVWQLPPGDRPLALAGNGLLLEDRSGQIRTWALTDGRLGPVLGRAASVIDIHGDEVAWRAAAGCRDGECPLHLTDASTGADRVVTPQPAHAGFLDGGSFSSDGAAVAAFISAPTQRGPGGQLVLIDTTAATVTNTVAGSVVPLAQGRSMAAAWPPDSAVVFFCGPTGQMHAYRPDDREAITVNAPASNNFVVW